METFRYFCPQLWTPSSARRFWAGCCGHTSVTSAAAFGAFPHIALWLRAKPPSSNTAVVVGLATVAVSENVCACFWGAALSGMWSDPPLVQVHKKRGPDQNIVNPATLKLRAIKRPTSARLRRSSSSSSFVCLSVV